MIGAHSERKKCNAMRCFMHLIIVILRTYNRFWIGMNFACGHVETRRAGIINRYDRMQKIKKNKQQQQQQHRRMDERKY